MTIFHIFTRFGIFLYKAVSERSCGRMLQADEFSRALLHLYRILAEGDHDSPFSIFACKGVSRKLGVLIAVLQPLCDTPWSKRTHCTRLLRTLVHMRITALDAEIQTDCT